MINLLLVTNSNKVLNSILYNKKKKNNFNKTKICISFFPTNFRQIDNTEFYLYRYNHVYKLYRKQHMNTKQIPTPTNHPQQRRGAVPTKPPPKVWVKFPDDCHQLPILVLSIDNMP